MNGMESENKKRKRFGYYIGIHGIAGWAIAGVTALALSSLFVLNEKAGYDYWRL